MGLCLGTIKRDSEGHIYGTDPMGGCRTERVAIEARGHLVSHHTNSTHIRSQEDSGPSPSSPTDAFFGLRKIFSLLPTPGLKCLTCKTRTIKIPASERNVYVFD